MIANLFNKKKLKKLFDNLYLYTQYECIKTYFVEPKYVLYRFGNVSVEQEKACKRFFEINRFKF